MSQTYHNYRQQIGEYGLVKEIKHPLTFVEGLPGAAIGELIIFESGGRGQVTALENDLVEIMILTPERLTPGTEVTRTGQQLEVSLGPQLRGTAINPLGQSLFDGSPLSGEVHESRPIDIEPPHINSRAPISQPFITGTSVIDLLLPLARGQREAVIGDPTTGKNSFLLTTLRSHAEHGIVVYAAIGKPWSDIKKVYNFIEQYTNQENVILLGTSAEDMISLTVLAPFAAMTIAEYWRDQGENVLLVLDDLSTHARFYREMGLLARRFPGRESYPGDMFHTHARLLERAGNFTHPEKGEVSITCLAVGETVRGELTSYIVSNLISIADGHLLFDEEIFSQGRRPSINIPLSVSRVGGHTQSAMVRELHRKLLLLLDRHQKAQSFTHFGAELNQDLQRVLEAGDRLYEFLSQSLFLAVPYPVQVVFVAMIWLGWINGYVGQVASWRQCLSDAYEENPEVRQLLDQLMQAKDLPVFAEQMKSAFHKLMTICQPAEISLPK